MYVMFSDTMEELSLPPATKLGQGYVFTRVCDSVHRGSASVHAGTPPTWEQTPQGADTAPPPERTSPPGQYMLGDMGNKRAVRILLECIVGCILVKIGSRISLVYGQNIR